MPQFGWPHYVAKPGRGAALDWANPLNRGLASYVLFDECAGAPFDLARRAPWSAVGSPTWAAAIGGTSPGMVFAGSGQYLTTGSAGPLTYRTGTGLTLECWYRQATAATTQDFGLVGKFDTNAGNGYMLAIDDTTQRPYIQADATTGTEARAGSTAVGNLYHVVGTLTWGGSSYTPRLYVNGADASDPATTVSGSTLTDSGRPATIAALADAAAFDHFLAGRIHLASIRTRAISAAEVLSLYRRPWQLLAPGPMRSWAWAATHAAAAIHARRTLSPRAGSRGVQ